MITGPKFKIARRLGAPIFEKTQTQRFKNSAEKKAGKGKPKKAGTNFAIQLVEKQKARFTYGISEKQFKNYVKKIIESKIANPHETLFVDLENRLDNVVYRIGLGSTRSFTRQLVSHGHIRVNNKPVNIPSFKVSKGDVISIREISLKKPVFSELETRLNEKTLPDWIVGKAADNKWTVTGAAKYNQTELLFDLNTVIQYYKR